MGYISTLFNERIFQLAETLGVFHFFPRVGLEHVYFISCIRDQQPETLYCTGKIHVVSTRTKKGALPRRTDMLLAKALPKQDCLLTAGQIAFRTNIVAMCSLHGKPILFHLVAPGT